MIKLKKQYKLSLKADFLFYLSLSIYAVIDLIRTTFFLSYIPLGVFVRIPYLCTLLLMLYEYMFLSSSDKIRLKVKDLYVMVVLFVLSVIVYINSNVHYAVYVGFILCARRIDVKKLSKIISIVLLVGFVFVVMSAKLGIIENYITVSDVRRREYLGFRYCLFPINVFFNIIAMYYYGNGRKMYWQEIFLFAAAALWLFMKTNARLGFICVAALLLFVTVDRLFNLQKFFKKRKYLLYIGSMTFFAALFISLFVVMNYDPKVMWMFKLNEALENRIIYSIKSLEMFGVNLMSSHPKWVGNGLSENGERYVGVYLYVDNFYINILQKFGIIFTLIIGLVISLSSCCAAKKNDYSFVLIWMIFLAHGFIDDLIFSLVYCGFLVMTFHYLYEVKEKITFSKLLGRLKNV